MQHLLEQFYSFGSQASLGPERTASSFFDTLDNQDKQWAIRATMKHEGDACAQMVDHLLERFCKHHWRRIVQDIKEEMIKAKQEKNNKKVNEVLERFAHLKRGILHRGLMR
jgi:septation ring formation regulator EzrA